MGGAGLTEGSSTVGLMLWPGKNGDLIITGVKVSSHHPTTPFDWSWYRFQAGCEMTADAVRNPT